MNIAEASAFRELKAEVALLKSQVQDLTRRMDDQSKAHRIIADDVEKAKTLSLKRANG